MINREIGLSEEIAGNKIKNKEQPCIPDDSNLDAEDNEKSTKRSRELLELKYISIEDYPELSGAIDIVSDEMNSERRKYNLPKVDFKYSDFRLIPERKFRNIPHVKECFKKAKFNVSAFYDTSTGVVFIKFDEKKYNSSRSEKLETQGRIVHDGVHKGMDKGGVRDFSGLLDEGFTEKKAREIMERRIILNTFRVKDYENRKASLTEERECGYAYDTDDILICERSEKEFSYGVLRSYVEETNVVKIIKENHPILYKELFESCLRGDSDNARRLIENTYGREVADLMSNEAKGTFGDLLEKMENADKSR